MASVARRGFYRSQLEAARAIESNLLLLRSHVALIDRAFVVCVDLDDPFPRLHALWRHLFGHEATPWPPREGPGPWSGHLPLSFEAFERVVRATYKAPGNATHAALSTSRGGAAPPSADLHTSSGQARNRSEGAALPRLVDLSSSLEAAYRALYEQSCR